MVGQSLEPGAHDKNARLFTILLRKTIYNPIVLIRVTIFAKINSEKKI